MTGRDPHEAGRAATSLELFYDLVFVVGFSVAGTQVGHALAEGHYRSAVIGYLLCTFAATWAWINFAWFASAFDTDDWFFRLTVLVQMIGVAVIAIGVPDVFTSLEGQEHLDNRVLVFGYIIMRVGMVAQWLRAAAQSPAHRRACGTYAAMTVLAQLGWIAVAVADMALWPSIAAMAVCVIVELLGPYLAETRAGGTPWHAHHIAERYACLTIVTLGEGVVGTVAVLGALIDSTGWTTETAVLVVSAMGTTFAMWWLYAALPVGAALHAHREKSFVWGYGHIAVFIAAAAAGAGLHVAALYIEHEAHIGAGPAVATLAVPVGLYCALLAAYRGYLVRPELLTLVSLVLALLFAAAGVILAAAGASLVVAIVATSLAPVVMVITDELGLARAERVR